MPPFGLIFQTKSNRPHSILKQLMLFDEIDYIEAYTFAMLVFIRKEEPFVIASSVCIIL